MQNITAYLERKNKLAKLFKQRVLSLDSAADRARIADDIENELSPENLTCDGELPAAQVRQRAKFLNAAAKELAAIK